MSINRHLYVNFKRKKGIRQGDPISPITFVLVMDYLTRALLFHSQQHQFLFFPLCREWKLVNLCFADDLTIFCKGHIPTIQITMQAFQHFSNATGMSANTQKSQPYFTGISIVHKEVECCRLSCFG